VDESKTLPTGSFEKAKHASLAVTAAAELSEEARLEGGRMVCLMAGPSHLIRYARSKMYRCTACCAPLTCTGVLCVVLPSYDEVRDNTWTLSNK